MRTSEASFHPFSVSVCVNLITQSLVLELKLSSAIALTEGQGSAAKTASQRGEAGK